MPLFTIDETKCQHDGICAAVCPRKIIYMDNNIPTPTPNAENICINCGHCVAVCPHGALSLEKMPLEQCPDLQENLKISTKQAEQFLKNRRSIRNFKSEPVEKEKIEKLIDIARYAPSGLNLQPVRWLVLQDIAEVKRLSGVVIDWMNQTIKENSPLASFLHMDAIIAAWGKRIDLISRNAPHLIITYGLTANQTAPQSCTIALTHLELAASAANIGACWAGYISLAASMFPPMQEALGLRSREKCMGAMLIGYPKFEYKRIPLRNEAQIKWQ